MPAAISHYAMIGDMRTAALVGRDGSIDWFCAPRFDSPACFAALLGTADNGRWKIAPCDGVNVHRWYRNGGLVLETEFNTHKGTVSVIDFMPVNQPESSIVRLVIGRDGAVEMRMELIIRFDYGYSVPWVNRVDEETLTAMAGPAMLVLRTPIALRGEDQKTVGRFTIVKGETVPFCLTYANSHIPIPPRLPSGEECLRQTEQFWTEWMSRSHVQGRWSAHVCRSLVVLKGLSFQATGGIVAAPTTSLPERLGGRRNWDYRYCWIRDAAFTLLAFLNAGYTEEAKAWQQWLVRAVAGSPQQLQIMYGVAGEREVREWQLPWVPGYQGSLPVRVGNAAAHQVQLDIYGEFVDVLEHAVRGGLPMAPRSQELRRAFLDHLKEIWRLPDAGIWEVRGTPQHFVHSKVMAWVAFDRASRDPEAVDDSGLRATWKSLAEEIHADVCQKGIDPDRGCFVQAYDSTRLDAALLLLPVVGFLPVTDPRIQATVAEIEKHLLVNGLVRRYDTAEGEDGLPKGEGAFLPCTFWLVDNYVLMGRLDKAVVLFERLLQCCNDVGLLSEEYDPITQSMLGNFPQAFSHVALVNSALTLMHEIGNETISRPLRRHETSHDRGEADHRHAQ